MDLKLTFSIHSPLGLHAYAWMKRPPSLLSNGCPQASTDPARPSPISTHSSLRQDPASILFASMLRRFAMVMRPRRAPAIIYDGELRALVRTNHVETLPAPPPFYNLDVLIDGVLQAQFTLVRSGTRATQGPVYQKLLLDPGFPTSTLAPGPTLSNCPSFSILSVERVQSLREALHMRHSEGLAPKRCKEDFSPSSNSGNGPPFQLPQILSHCLRKSLSSESTCLDQSICQACHAA